LGGAIGSVLRYLVAIAITHRFGHEFPYGTLLVNLSGSFLIGALAQFLLRHPADVSTFLRVLLIVGVLGGYTTFSSFSYENLGLLTDGRLALALAYAAGSVVAGTAAAYAGMSLIRLLS
jgi:CrcB protein